MLTRNLTILLTDIKGFTDKSSHKTRAEIQQMLDKHKEIVLPILEGKGGKLVKTIGDAFLMTFESPTDAVLAGIEVQEALRAFNADKDSDHRIEIRIAINQGEVNLSEGDVYGEPVNITARIEAIAEANEVFFTDAVYLAMNKKEVPSSEVGLLQLKGIPEKVRVYKVKRETPLGESRGQDADGVAPGPVAAAIEAGRAAGKAAGLVRPLAAAAVGVVAGLSGTKIAKPTLMKRMGALLIDACLCGIIVSALVPGDRQEIRIHKSRKARAAAEASPAAPPAEAKADPNAPTLSSLVAFGAACASDLNTFCAQKKGDMTKCLKQHEKALQPSCAAQLGVLTKKGSGIVIDEKGIHGAGISIDENGVKAPGVSIDDKGVHAPGVAIDDRGVRVPGFSADEHGVTVMGIRIADADARPKKDVDIKLDMDGVSVDDGSKDEDDDEDGGWKVKTIKHEKKFPWFALCWFIYSIVFIKRMGTTPGGRICKLQIVQHPSGQPLDKSANTMRAFVSLVSGWCLGLGYLWALWEKDGRGWHDLMAGTKVVSVE